MYRVSTPEPPPKRHRLSRSITLIVAVLFAGYIGWSFIAVPREAFAGTPLALRTGSTGQPNISWPAQGQAAIGTAKAGILSTNGAQTAVPIASIAKVMLALSVLKTKPIDSGQQGATLTLTQADVDIYNAYVAKDGSVALVQAGEQISEYQALQALLLPSANNFADTLANWAFGSVSAYDTYANSYAQTLGLGSSHFADASGYDPGTVSSASDLIKLGQLALSNSIIADIIDQPSATIPVAGLIHNVNSLLGGDGIIGIKTGNTDQAGGCLLLAAKYTLGGQTITILVAVLGATNLQQALSASHALLASAQSNFVVTTAVKSGQPVGSYRLPWGAHATAYASGDIKAVTWKGSVLTANTVLNRVRTPATSGQVIGQIAQSSPASASNQTVPITLGSALPDPSLWWRLTHPSQTWQLRFSG